MEKIKERKKQAWDNMIYSVQRFDLLIISTCAAGVYASLEIIKFNFVQHITSYLFLIKISGFFFLLGVVLNFLSQHYGLKANKYDYLMCETKIELAENNNNEILAKTLEDEVEKYDNLSEEYSNLTDLFNRLSMYSLFAGCIFITSYIIMTF